MLIDAIGLVTIILLSSARLSQVFNGEGWAFPLLFHSILAVILLLIHRKSTSTTNLWKKLIAWISAFLPLGMRISGEVSPAIQGLSVLGVVFSLWGLISLGRSFDIGPADRGLVQEGPYRFLRHPIYTGELFSVAVVALAEMTLWNGLILLVLVITLIARIIWEERIINGYPVYANKVRNRLVPGIW